MSDTTSAPVIDQTVAKALCAVAVANARAKFGNDEIASTYGWEDWLPDARAAIEALNRTDATASTDGLVERDWLIAQLEAWPRRVDPERTINIEFLMKSAATALSSQATASTGLVELRPEDCATSDEAQRHLAIRSPLNRTIYKVIRDYRLSNMADEDGHPYPLVDCLSNPAPADIGTGEMEMVALTDEIEAATATAIAEAEATMALRKALNRCRIAMGDLMTGIGIHNSRAVDRHVPIEGPVVTALTEAHVAALAVLDRTTPGDPRDAGERP